MSARASLAPGSARRGPSLFSSSLASSQTAGPSSQSIFSFRPHVLLSQGANNDTSGPLLDYSDLTDRIEVFKEVFLAQTGQAIEELKRTSEEHASRLREEEKKVELTKEAIERQREEQKKMYQSECVLYDLLLFP